MGPVSVIHSLNAAQSGTAGALDDPDPDEPPGLEELAAFCCFAIALFSRVILALSFDSSDRSGRNAAMSFLTSASCAAPAQRARLTSACRAPPARQPVRAGSSGSWPVVAAKNLLRGQ